MEFPVMHRFQKLQDKGLKSEGYFHEHFQLHLFRPVFPEPRARKGGNMHVGSYALTTNCLFAYTRCADDASTWACACVGMRVEKRACPEHARAARTRAACASTLRLSSPSKKGFTSAGNGHLWRRYCHYNISRLDATVDSARTLHRNKINKLHFNINAQCHTKHKAETAQDYWTRHRVHVKKQKKKKTF